MIFKKKKKERRERKVSVREIAAMLNAEGSEDNSGKIINLRVGPQPEEKIVKEKEKNSDRVLKLKIFFLLAALAGGYLLRFTYFPRFFGWQQATYIFTPLYWLVVTVLVSYLAGFKFKEFSGERKHGLLSGAFIFGWAYVLIFFLSGLLLGFGKSPYLFTFEGITFNLVLVFSALIGIEFSRAYLVKGLSGRSFLAALLIPAFLFTAINLSPSKFQLFFLSEGARATVTFLLSYFLPLLSENFFLYLHTLVVRWQP